MFLVGFHLVFSLLGTALYGLTLFVCLALIAIAVCYAYERLRGSVRRRFSEENSTKGLLHKKHVIVTGGSSGIGKCVAIEAARLGANVTVIARNQEKLERARDEIEAARRNKAADAAGCSQTIDCVYLDLACGDYEAIKLALDEAQARLGPCYMLVNNAGAAVCAKIEDTTPKMLRAMMELNVIGTYHCTRAVLPWMKQQREGKVVLVSSQAGLLGIFGMSAYCMSKCALRSFAETLSMEAKPYNISVTLSLPPDTDTPGFAEENKTKPLETKLISESGGLFAPETVAKRLVKDALDQKFFSYNGLESFMLTTLASGMSPHSSLSELLLSSLLMGPFKLISVYFLETFRVIVERCMKEREKHKKTE